MRGETLSQSISWYPFVDELNGFFYEVLVEEKQITTQYVFHEKLWVFFHRLILIQMQNIAEAA